MFTVRHMGVTWHISYTGIYFSITIFNFGRAYSLHHKRKEWIAISSIWWPIWYSYHTDQPNHHTVITIILKYISFTKVLNWEDRCVCSFCCIWQCSTTQHSLTLDWSSRDDITEITHHINILNMVYSSPCNLHSKRKLSNLYLLHYPLLLCTEHKHGFPGRQPSTVTQGDLFPSLCLNRIKCGSSQIWVSDSSMHSSYFGHLIQPCMPSPWACPTALVVHWKCVHACRWGRQKN